jgi:hypothetical protein
MKSRRASRAVPVRALASPLRALSSAHSIFSFRPSHRQHPGLVYTAIVNGDASSSSSSKRSFEQSSFDALRGENVDRMSRARALGRDAEVERVGVHEVDSIAAIDGVDAERMSFAPRRAPANAGAPANAAAKRARGARSVRETRETRVIEDVTDARAIPLVPTIRERDRLHQTTNFELTALAPIVEIGLGRVRLKKS